MALGPWPAAELVGAGGGTPAQRAPGIPASEGLTWRGPQTCRCALRLAGRCAASEEGAGGPRAGGGVSSGRCRVVGALLCRTPGPGVRGRQVLTCAPRPPSLSPLPGRAHPVFAGPVALPAVSLGPAAHVPQSLLLTCGEAGSQLGGVGVSHGCPAPRCPTASRVGELWWVPTAWGQGRGPRSPWRSQGGCGHLGTMVPARPPSPALPCTPLSVHPIPPQRQTEPPTSAGGCPPRSPRASCGPLGRLSAPSFLCSPLPALGFLLPEVPGAHGRLGGQLPAGVCVASMLSRCVIGREWGVALLPPPEPG